MATGLALAVAGFLASGNNLAAQQPAAEPGAVAAKPWATEAPSISVVDADTVEQAGQRWRLTGFDTPEIHRAKCAAERERGINAAARLIALLAERGGVLTPEINGRGRLRRDKFGRTLGTLAFGDGVQWAALAVSEGYAVAWDGRGRQPSWCPAPAG